MSEMPKGEGGEPPARKSGRWYRVGAVLLISATACAAFAWWRVRVPRCEVESLEQLGRDLADDDPVARLERTPEVVEALERSCAVVSFETARATATALRQPGLPPPQSSAPWRVTGSERYGCADQAGHTISNDDEWRHCLELGGLPEQLVGRRSIQPSALWTVLMLEHLDVSPAAAQQLGWVLSTGHWLPLGDVERARVRSPVVELWTALSPPDAATLLGVEYSAPGGNLPDGFIIDRDATVAQMLDARVGGAGRFHAYSVALGPAFPADVWIPLQIQWTDWDCEDQSDCALPFAEDEASTVAILGHGEVTYRTSRRPPTPLGTAHVLAPESQATWGEVFAVAMSLAPTECFGDELPSACEQPWVTLWLNGSTHRPRRQ